MKQSDLDKLLSSNYISHKPDLTPGTPTQHSNSDIVWGIIGMIIVGLLTLYFTGAFPSGNSGP